MLARFALARMTRFKWPMYVTLTSLRISTFTIHSVNAKNPVLAYPDIITTITMSFEIAGYFRLDRIRRKFRARRRRSLQSNSGLIEQRGRSV